MEAGVTPEAVQTQRDQITAQLAAHGIEFGEWGKNKAKTVDDLTREVIEGETSLIEDAGELIRRIELVHVDVRYQDDTGEWQLVEEKQVFDDGRVRERGHVGVGEKMKPGENPLVSAARALKEELGIETEVEVQPLGFEEELRPSPSYPGLTTQYRRHDLITQLPKEAFDPAGYVEVQPGLKTTYFIWREIPPQA